MASQPNVQQVDQQITQLILQVGEDMTQPIASGTFVPNGNNNVVNIPMRQVGLTRGFIVKVSATFANTDTAVAAHLTSFGAANLISNFTVTDLDNYQRVNTTGWHMWMLNTAKEGFPFGAALLSTSTDEPVAVGDNYSAISATPTLATSTGTGTINFYYWVPLAYAKSDLRGALYTGVVNATAFLQFTVNPTPVVTSGDAVLACYSQPAATAKATMTSFTYTVYQNYIDQLPRYTQGANKGAPILPPISQSTQYRLVNTALSAISANQQFPIPFTNFQSFLSASVIYDQNGTLNPGTDISFWFLAAANTLQFFQLDPITQAFRSRIKIKTDWPSGAYMFDFRDQPVNTNQAGNMQLMLQPSSAAAGSQVLVGWESFANVNQVLGAQSLPAS
jgi:P3 major capsid protein